jgi:hypothetical protein
MRKRRLDPLADIVMDLVDVFTKGSRDRFAQRQFWTLQK